MSTSLRSLFLSALLVVPLACKSDEPAAPERSEAPVSCTCGDAATDFEGCAHALCIAGKNNPDNPNCVCGDLSLGQ